MAERAHEQLPDSVLVDWLQTATDRRMGALLEAFRRGWSIERVHEITRITLVPATLREHCTNGIRICQYGNSTRFSRSKNND